MYAGKVVTIVAPATAGRRVKRGKQLVSAPAPTEFPFPHPTARSNARCVLRKRSWAEPVRRAPASSISDAPATAPTRIASATHERHRPRSSLRNRYVAALTASFYVVDRRAQQSQADD